MPRCAKMLDVSHVIPLSLDSQVLGVAAEVIELVHVDFGSPIADLAATVATRLPCLNEFSIPNPESRIHPESINAKQCQAMPSWPSGSKWQSHRSRPSPLDAPSSQWTRSFAASLPFQVVSRFSWDRRDRGQKRKSADLKHPVRPDWQ